MALQVDILLLFIYYNFALFPLIYSILLTFNQVRYSFIIT